MKGSEADRVVQALAGSWVQKPLLLPSPSPTFTTGLGVLSPLAACP